ncbi:MAG: hypothetical protein ABSC04_07865 [Syntrophobacteraceae bacterium]|jgi:hypothetical protein
MERWQFPIRKGGIFRPAKEIEGLRGGVHGYAAQASPKIDAARAEKDPFRMETRPVLNPAYPGMRFDLRP